MGFAAAGAYADNSGAGVEVYGKAGFAGVGVGYGVNERFTVRGDFMTVGSPSHDFDEDDIKYDVELKNNKFNLMADYFPMNNGFRITAGLGFGKTKLDGYGVARNQTTHNLKIGNQRYDIAVTGNDKVYAKVEYPNVSPYIGIGWGTISAKDLRAAGASLSTWAFSSARRTPMFRSATA